MPSKLTAIVNILFVLNFGNLSKQDDDVFVKIVQHVADYSQLMGFSVNASVEHLIIFPNEVIQSVSSDKRPHRVKIWSTNASIDYPLITSVRHGKEVLSWQIPLLVESSNSSKSEEKLPFMNTSRTLCPSRFQMVQTEYQAKSVLHRTITLLSTSSPKPIQVCVVLEEETDFYLSHGSKYKIKVSPSEPKFFYYRLENRLNNNRCEFR